MTTEGGAGDGTRLIWFPHAGGSPTAVRNWRKLLPDGIELVALRYPGRPGDGGTPAASSFQHLLARIVDQLTRLRDRPMALFGHSMGAAVAYEAAAVLEARFGWPVRHLFVSGRGAPHRIPQSRSENSTDDQLVADLRRLGGQHLSILDDRSFRDMFLPVLRADLRLIEGHHSQGRPISAPITAFVGAEDPICGVNDARAWRGYTSGGFTFRTFPGGHFYIEDHEPKIVATVVRTLHPGDLAPLDPRGRRKA